MKASMVKALLREETHGLYDDIERLENRLNALAESLGKHVGYNGLPKVTDIPKNTE